jgi:hypothetical protein
VFLLGGFALGVDAGDDGARFEFGDVFVHWVI